VVAQPTVLVAPVHAWQLGTFAGAPFDCRTKLGRTHRRSAALSSEVQGAIHLCVCVCLCMCMCAMCAQGDVVVGCQESRLVWCCLVGSMLIPFCSRGCMRLCACCDAQAKRKHLSWPA
jgi:hypothetical protein